MLAISIPATTYADSWGRRTSVIVDGVGRAGCMYIIDCLNAAGSVYASEGAGQWFVIVLIFVFALLYVSTWELWANLRKRDTLSRNQESGQQYCSGS